MSSWPAISVEHMIIIDSADCFINEVLRTYYTISVHTCIAHQTVAFLLWNSFFWIFLVFICLKHDFSKCSQILGREWSNLQNEPSDVRSQDPTTCCQYNIKKRYLVEHIRVIVTNELLLSCKETCDLFFSLCSVWRRESLNMQLLFSRTALGAHRSKIILFATSALKLGALLTSSTQAVFLGEQPLGIFHFLQKICDTCEQNITQN